MSQTSPIPGYGEELASILVEKFPTGTCMHRQTLPAKHSATAPWPTWVHPPLREYLVSRSITLPFTHQVACAQAAWEGRDVVVATGTSSGKSLCYQLPILSRMAQDPLACALYITPTKALGSDQLASASTIARSVAGLEKVTCAPYDGDTPQEARAAIREQARMIFSNPDMIHTGILPNHQRWGRVLRHLAFIVVDECHSYRGVFGAHVGLVLRRFLRICARYGSSPTVILASATSNDPGAHAANLIGRPVEAITCDGAPQGARTIMTWEPATLDGVEGENGAPVRRSAASESASIMAALVAEGARTLSFVRTRRQAEIVAMRCQEELSIAGRHDLASRIAAYRAGYLAEDRRKLERGLDDGTLVGVASTNALELGIDVGGLDAVVMAGYPGTAASFWQQAGRAGRRGQGSLVTLVARDEPMDNYFLHHPEALIGRPIERTVFNPRNPHILSGHVYCAALEAPLSDAEVAALGAQEVVQDLAAQGYLRRRRQGWYASLEPGQPDPHEQVTLRGTGEQLAIIDQTDGRLLGTIDGAQAQAQTHPGAIYIHQGESFVVDELDLEQRLVVVHPELPDYTTHSRSITDIRIVSDPDQIANPAPGLWVSNLEVEVLTQVVGYIRRSHDGTTVDMVALDLPPDLLRTRAVAYTIDPLVLDQLGITDIPGALHAAEHAAIGMLPLIATCDRWDIGGVSTQLHQDTGLPTVFVYDGYPGGAGFADCGFERFPEWIAATYDNVRLCSCESGCPSCVQSPKCGNGNSPLSKQGALALLGAMCAMMGVTP